MLVYVCAPYGYAEEVREVHSWLRSLNWEPVSHWAELAKGAEDFSNPDVIQAALERNDSDLARSTCVLVLAKPNQGGEMFAEAGEAIRTGKKVFWVGRPILSAFRPGVRRFADVERAVAAMRDWDA